jgi:predicted Fe-S protein YdhL (DUF1289 family)
MRLRMIMCIILLGSLLCVSNVALYAEQVISDAKLSVMVKGKGPAWQRLDRAKKEALIKQISENCAKNTAGEAILKTVPESIDAIDAYYARGGEAMNDSLATAFHAVNVGDLKRRFASGTVGVQISPDGTASVISRDTKQVIMAPSESKAVLEKYRARQVAQAASSSQRDGASKSNSSSSIDGSKSPAGDTANMTGRDWKKMDPAAKESIISALCARCSAQYPLFKPRKPKTYVSKLDSYYASSKKIEHGVYAVFASMAFISYLYTEPGVYIDGVDGNNASLGGFSITKVSKREIPSGDHRVDVSYSGDGLVSNVRQDYLSVSAEPFASYLIKSNKDGRVERVFQKQDMVSKSVYTWRPEIIKVDSSRLFKFKDGYEERG